MQILFSTNSDFISKAILFFTKISWLKRSTISHVALRFGGKESNWMIESNKNGFVPNWFPYFEKKEKKIIRFEILQIEERILEEIIEKQIDIWVNKKYDIGNILGFIIVIFLYKLTGKKNKNIFALPHYFICSEGIYKIFKEVEKQTGICFFEDKDPELVLPEELLIDCENKKNLFKKIEI